MHIFKPTKCLSNGWRYYERVLKGVELVHLKKKALIAIQTSLLQKCWKWQDLIQRFPICLQWRIIWTPRRYKIPTDCRLLSILRLILFACQCQKQTLSVMHRCWRSIVKRSPSKWYTFEQCHCSHLIQTHGRVGSRLTKSAFGKTTQSRRPVFHLILSDGNVEANCLIISKSVSLYIWVSEASLELIYTEYMLQLFCWW